jgi:predicted metal-dependent phosphotriesterase family hydrolase
MKTKYIFSGAILLFLFLCACTPLKETGYIYSVNGKLTLDSLKVSLTHEHVMSRFGAKADYNAVYDTVANFKQVLPYLKKIKSLGINSIFDCTTAYFGRNVETLKKLSDESGITIITNTGFYGAYNDRYVPEFAFDLSEEEIAEIWIKEFEEGIDETGIKPGFIKLAFDAGEPSEIDLKLFKAGILTHKKTGLTMAVHTVDNLEAATKQLELLELYNVNPRAWIWTHANKVKNEAPLIEAATKGAWISLDGVNENNIQEYIPRLNIIKEHHLLHKVLLSHDGNSFPNGQKIRPYDAIPMHLIPALKSNGYSQEDINQLLIINPKEAFKIKLKS